MRLLIVEDNHILLESICRLLSDEFEVDIAKSGDEGVYKALQNIYDAILLDVLLPEMDGFTIVKEIREQKIKTPVLFLTAKDSLEDRVKGLDLGGDDYLIKPFQAEELKARLRALLRRSGSLTLNSSIKYMGIELFGKEQEINIEGVSIKLTLKQYELLEFFIQHTGMLLTREQIYDRVWGFNAETTETIVEVYVHQLRKKLEPFGYHKQIKTIRGLGYMLMKQGE